MHFESENGRLKLGPGWASIVVTLLVLIVGGILHTSIRIAQIEIRLENIEHQTNALWQRGK